MMIYFCNKNMIIYFYDYSLAAVSSCCTSSQAVTVLVIFTICSLLVYSISLVTTRLDRSFVWAFPLSCFLRLVSSCCAWLVKVYGIVGKYILNASEILIRIRNGTDNEERKVLSGCTFPCCRRTIRVASCH